MKTKIKTKIKSSLQKKLNKRQNNQLLNPDIISHRYFNFIMGVVILYGFLINWLIVTTVPIHYLTNISWGFFLLGYLISCTYGCYLFISYNKPIISFIGYNFVVVPFGLVVHLLVSHYDPDLVINAMKLTIVVTIFMMFMGHFFPEFFKSIYRSLLIATVIAVLFELFLMIVIGDVPSIMDWIIGLLFCAWIGYDWSFAQSLPKTVDNAVDGAASMYMSIINVFLRILSIFGD